MSFFLTAFVMNFKRVIKTKAFAFIILFLSVIILMTSYFLKQESSIINIKIGVVYGEDNKYAKEIYYNINQSDSIDFISFFADERLLVEQMVKTGELECAYVISDNIEQSVIAGDFNKIITLVESPRTVADAIANEIILASVIETSAIDITTSELVKYFGVDFENTKIIIGQKIHDYYSTEIDSFWVSDYYNKGKIQGTESDSNNINQRILHGFIAIIILITTVFLLPRFIEEKKKGISKKLGYKNMFIYYISLFLTILILNFILGSISIGIIKLIYPKGIVDLQIEAQVLLMYCASVSMIGIALIGMLKNSTVIYSGFIFVLILFFCFGGIFFDLAEINADFGTVSNILISNSYINCIMNNDRVGFMALLASFAISLVLAVAFLIRGKNRL